MKYLTYPALLILLAFLPAQNVHGGAWTQAKGAAYYKIGTSVVRATEFFEGNGNKIKIPTVSEYTLSFYGEYGLTEQLTAVAYVPFLTRVTVNEQVGRTSGFVYTPGDENTGFGDADLGIRYGLLQAGPTVLSAQLLLGLPLGDDDHENALFTGDGEFNQIITAQVGHSLYPLAAYVNADIGFNNRSNGYSDEFRYSLEFGYTPLHHLTVIARAIGVQSLNNGDATAAGMAGLHVNDQQYLTLGVQVTYELSPRLGLAAGYESATNAENVLSAPAYSFGVFAKIP